VVEGWLERVVNIGSGVFGLSSERRGQFIHYSLIRDMDDHITRIRTLSGLRCDTRVEFSDIHEATADDYLATCHEGGVSG
jgi:hypothetical protein